jgi:hypothetical protein
MAFDICCGLLLLLLILIIVFGLVTRLKLATCSRWQCTGQKEAHEEPAGARPSLCAVSSRHLCAPKSAPCRLANVADVGWRDRDDCEPTMIMMIISQLLRIALQSCRLAMRPDRHRYLHREREEAAAGCHGGCRRLAGIGFPASPWRGRASPAGRDARRNRDRQGDATQQAATKPTGCRSELRDVGARTGARSRNLCVRLWNSGWP